MTPRLSGHFSIDTVFGLVFFVFKSFLRIARQIMDSCKFCHFDPKALKSCYIVTQRMLVSLPFHFCVYIIIKLIK